MCQLAYWIICVIGGLKLDEQVDGDCIVVMRDGAVRDSTGGGEPDGARFGCVGMVLSLIHI